MLWLHFTIVLLAFGRYSFSESDYLQNENKYFTENTSSHRMEFHEIHGEEIVLSRRGTVATRTGAYCHGMTFTKKPVEVNERISVKILKRVSTHASWLHIGFTGSDPLTLQPLMSECWFADRMNRTWAEKVDKIYADQESVFSYYVDERGVVHYGRLDEDKVLFQGVNTSSDLWAVFHVRGETVSILLLGNSSGVLSLPGVEASREKGISYMMSLRNTDWGWTENTHRAIVALYLSGAMAFNGTTLEQQLMVKELELQTSLAISRNSSVPLSANELALYINALLVTCQNPRNFHGFDLIALLKKEIHLKGNATHPFVYIVLCNANETIPHDRLVYLQSMLDHDSKYIFWTDFRAMAIMALSCNLRRNGTSPREEPHIKSAVKDFLDLQYPDGSFGSIYTSALVVQALLASGYDQDPEWDPYDAVMYFQSKQNSSDGQSFGDFLTTSLILPILNGKSLADVVQVKCPDRKDGNVTNFEDNLLSGIRVQYSLYFKDNMKRIHSVSLNVPSNVTVLDVMNLAAKEGPKFKFQYKILSGQMYVYSIGNVANDPEKGMFWLLYLSTKETGRILKTESPGKIFLSGEEHIIMWYKTADIYV